MAERSVRTRRANMQLYTPQEVAAPAQAIARGMGQLSNSMDRMSQFFAEKASMEAEIEGQQYGARNAPTAEQLQDAFQSGEELELPGGFGTVFDRAARKAALDITQTEIEFEARKRINEIITTATLNGTNPSTMLDDIDAVTHGFAATFDDNSPGVARKLRAGLSIWANSQMASYENSYIADQKAKSKSQFVSTLLGTMEGLSKIIEFGLETKKTDPVTGEKIYTPLTAQDLVYLKLGEIEKARLKGFAPSQLTTIGNMFDAGIVEAANRVLVDSVLLSGDPRQAISAIGKGKVTGLKIATQNAVATLRGQNLSFSDIAKELRDRHTDEINYLETVETSKNTNNEKLEEIYVSKALEAIADGDVEVATSYILLTKTVNPVRGTELQIKFLEGGETRTISSSEALIALEGLDDNIRVVHLETYGNELSLADQRKYFKRAEFYQNEEVQAALTFLKGELILPQDLATVSKDDPNYKSVAVYRRLEGRLKTAAFDAKREKAEFDAFEVARELMAAQGEDFGNVVQQLEVRRANDIITRINFLGNGDYSLQPGQFQETIDVLRQIIADKKLNNGNYSRRIKETNIISLRDRILNIQKAME